MAMLVPATPVAGAPRIQLPYGIFSVLAPRPEDSARWQGGGVTWDFFESADLGLIGPVQTDQADTFGLPKKLREISDDATPSRPYLGTATPFTIYSPYVVTPIGWSPEEAQARAFDALYAFEQEKVEEAFWRGVSGNVPNLNGDSTDVGTFALADSADAVGALEDFLADTYGSQGVLHMSRRQAIRLMDKGVLKADGSRLTTVLGTPVVAGGGYPTGTIRATPALFGYRSEPFTSSDSRGDLLDRKTNDLYTIAERTYLIGFDPTGVGAVTITS
jgi:hypothetical protein